MSDLSSSDSHASNSHEQPQPNPSEAIHANDEPIASTSALAGRDAEATSGLRERTRAPYARVVPAKDEAVGSASPPSSSKGKERGVDDELKDKVDALFACHICLETPSSDDCVVTKCGHVFCWSDLSEWLESNPPATSQCPVCKSQIKDVQEEVIPIYSGGRNDTKDVDPRTRPRPKPKVTPAPQPQQRPGMFGNGMQGLSPFWDVGGGPGGSGWTVQAGVFPFPGLSLGWSNAQRGTQPAVFAHTINPPMTPTQAQEQARIQQRNALIAFVVMIVLFTLLATVQEME